MAKYATNSICDAYHRFKRQDDGYLYAFGVGEFFVFVLGDAHTVHNLMPDLFLEKSSSGYDQVRVHAAGYFQLVYRLVAMGQKVAQVSRRITERRKAAYDIRERFDRERLGK